MARLKRERVFWSCERCGRSGRLTVTTGRGAWDTVIALTDRHRIRSPECRGGVRGLRVSMRRAVPPASPAREDQQ